MTLSTSHLLEAGNTRLVVLLITIKTNPSASSLRRGRASSLMRGSALRRLSEALRLGAEEETLIPGYNGRRVLTRTDNAAPLQCSGLEARVY